MAFCVTGLDVIFMFFFFLSRSTIACKFKLQTKACTAETERENYFKKHKYEMLISVAHSNTALSFVGIMNVIVHHHK